MGNLNWGQVAGGVTVGLILGIGGTLYLQNERIARLEERVAISGEQPLPPARSPVDPRSADVPRRDPHQLSEFIKQEQRRHVRASSGELAHEAFTDADLEKFETEKRPAAIAATLLRDKDYLATVIALKRASPPDRERILSASDTYLRQTFEQKGQVGGLEGQTDAGQKAEKLIAAEIVRVTKALLEKSEAELAVLYVQ